MELCDHFRELGHGGHLLYHVHEIADQEVFCGIPCEDSHRHWSWNIVGDDGMKSLS
jgi:hypothetical protein